MWKQHNFYKYRTCKFNHLAIASFPILQCTVMKGIRKQFVPLSGTTGSPKSMDDIRGLSYKGGWMNSIRWKICFLLNTRGRSKHKAWNSEALNTVEL